MSISQEQGRPTRAFYEGNPRAAALRTLCMQVVEVSDTILRSGGQDGEAIDELLDLDSRLAEMGVVPSMHTIEDDDPLAEEKWHKIITDPVMMAEYVAGWARHGLLWGNPFGSEDSDVALAEHDGTPESSSGLSAYRVKALSANARNHLYSDLIIRHTANMLDYWAGPSELPS